MSEEQNVIIVGMAEVKLASAPALLVTRGLGSCVGITFHDPTRRIGALAHPMLPDIDRARVKSNPAKFVNSVIGIMLEEFKKEGSTSMNIRAKIFGGGHMFSAIPHDSPFNIGVKNVDKAKEVLAENKIILVAQDTGGNFGRTVELNVATGKVTIKTIFHGDKEL